MSVGCINGQLFVNTRTISTFLQLYVNVVFIAFFIRNTQEIDRKQCMYTPCCAKDRSRYMCNAENRPHFNIMIRQHCWLYRLGVVELGVMMVQWIKFWRYRVILGCLWLSGKSIQNSTAVSFAMMYGKSLLGPEYVTWSCNTNCGHYAKITSQPRTVPLEFNFINSCTRLSVQWGIFPIFPLPQLSVLPPNKVGKTIWLNCLVYSLSDRLTACFLPSCIYL